VDPADEIRSLLEEQASCWNRGELNRYLSYYAQDAVYLPSDGPPLHGVIAIRRSLEARYGFVTRPLGRLTYCGLFSRAVSPNLAFAVGSYRVDAAEAGCPPRTGRFSLLLRRRDQTWEILLDHPN
jgi:uncharacterized protein (TIGR02246 family)